MTGIELNKTATIAALALCQEGYQQPNELPSHAKYAMRTRRKDKELGPPLRFGDASEKDRIVGATLTNQMLQTSAPPALLFFPLRFCLPKSSRL